MRWRWPAHSRTGEGPLARTAMGEGPLARTARGEGPLAPTCALLWNSPTTWNP